MYKRITILFICSCILLSACKKFLSEKPSASLVVPQTTNDLQALLDNTNLFNASWPYAVEIGSDDYYITTTEWEPRPAAEKNGYIWATDVFNENERNAWSLTYNIVYTANNVTDALNNKIEGTQKDINNVKGQALFFRSFAFNQLLQIFAKPYNEATADTDLGIPLRLDADLNKKTFRATLKQSYEQIIADSKLAAQLLPDSQTVKTRPSKQAAFALLARTFVQMQKYPEALLYADSALLLNNYLLDFNTLNTAATRPVPQFNREVIFHAVLLTSNTINLNAKIDSVLYTSYNTNDKRKQAFFKLNSNGTQNFKGSFDGSARLFNGFTVAELYLIRAEIMARQNRVNEAMIELNTLLVKRWKSGTFIPFTANTSVEALNIILNERRKELLLRGIRWSDLRRLNKEPATEKTISRVLNNNTYLLPPGNIRYTFQIPQLVIQMTGIPQNE